jgi:hypothetical protein
MLLRIILLGLALVCAGSARADTLKTEGELRVFGDRVMAALVKGGTSAAFAAMKPYTQVSDSEFQSLAHSSKSQRDNFGVRYGKTLGYEFISQRKVGESLVRIVYIEKTEKHALPWIFFFYKTPGGWALNTFQWNDQMPQLFYQ